MPMPSQFGGGSPVVPVESESEALTGPVLPPGSVAVADAESVVVPLALAEVASETVLGVLCESLTEFDPPLLSPTLAVAVVVGVVPAVPELASVSELLPLSSDPRPPSSPQPTTITPSATHESRRARP